MKLKGDYDSVTEYNVGDVVRYTDGIAYHKLAECPAGTDPVDTRYWSRTNQVVNDIVGLVMDGLEMASDAAGAMVNEVQALIPMNINDECIILKSGDNEYLVSVDATGDTPEVIAELVVPDEEEGGDT